MKILIVEDEAALAGSIGAYLGTGNYSCDYASDLQQALYKIEQNEYDCILLDLMLPGGSGMKIPEELRKDNRKDGLIIISAKTELNDRVEGLKAGADDYLSKPFHLPELAARIHSVIRRKQFENNDSLSYGELRIDIPSKAAYVHDKLLQLTKSEFDLLLYFLINKNKVISKAAIAARLSGDLADVMGSYDFIYAHIKNLKRKLQEAGCENYLKTIYGTGYKWSS